MSEKSSPYCVYEQPLSERMRLFMRLESIFLQMHLFHKADEYYSIQLFLDALFDVLDFLHRYEIRSEILKELHRLKTAIARDNIQCLEHFKSHTEMEDAIDHALNAIHDIDLNPISMLRENELFNSLRQRNFNQSGNCLFEVPAYQFWLAKNIHNTNPFLIHCYNLFIPISDAISLVLGMVRACAECTEESTHDGMFLKTLDKDKRNQILRIHLDPQHNVFPRISGDNHRFAIRFMEQDNPQMRSVQTNRPVHFALQVCAL
ncbi:cell division protein ZapD [Suttonella ornithocola]|uniref:Cell division protein ZapD n=1 Tax=Suttonella ornithocola TaxID=279832 RepID=A0A380MR78_9GAMM|nr:cell division protein ZapD [Suttonella ornithocola]SUO95110.1 Protein of uncharacterised function (DUF1342) [Suttonella ornithocola]